VSPSSLRLDFAVRLRFTTGFIPENFVQAMARDFNRLVANRFQSRSKFFQCDLELFRSFQDAVGLILPGYKNLSWFILPWAVNGAYAVFTSMSNRLQSPSIETD
jgi:hypothetical protein